jgi:hypothetical protein
LPALCAGSVPTLAPEQVRDAIDRFVRVYNEDAAPFEWRKTSVRAAQPALKYAQLRK